MTPLILKYGLLIWNLLWPYPQQANLLLLGTGGPASSGGTLSFVQGGGCTFTNAYSCSVTMSTGSLTAGNLYIVLTDGGKAFEGTLGPVIVAGTQTYCNGASAVCTGFNTMNLAPGCSTGFGGATWLPYCYYVLPGAASGGASPITVKFTAPTGISGSITGTFQVGETLTQGTSGATGILYLPAPWVRTGFGSNAVVMYNITGTPDATHVWTGGTSGATFTPNEVPEVSTGHAYIAEVNPSANGAQVGLDNDSALWNLTAGTTQSGPAFTTSGTSPFQVSVIIGGTGNITLGTPFVNSPYSNTNQNYHNGNNEGFAGAQTATTPQWTLASATAYTRGMVFSYNPSAFTEAMYLGFDNCTSGSALTTTCLNSSTNGYLGMTWAEIGTGSGCCVTANTTAKQARITPSPRMGDGTTISAGAGTMGLVFTGNGTAVEDRWRMRVYSTQVVPSDSAFGAATLGGWINYNVACSGAANTVPFSLIGVNETDFADLFVAPNGGTCQFGLGSGHISSATLRNNEWYWVSLFYSANSSVSHNVKVFTNTAITGGSCSAGTETLTTGGLPADGNVITGASAYVINGTQASWQGPFSITVSGSSVSFSQTCPGPGYSTGNILVQLGSTATTAANGTPWGGGKFGLFSNNAVPNLATVSMDSLIVDASATPADPILP